ncbi:MAG: P-type DNA transfer ATPase VirB11 [Gammaproteobacteria bacterium]
MHILLNNLLTPLHQYLQDPDITDISINQPFEIWVDDGRQAKSVHIPDLSLRRCYALAQQIATYCEQTINEERPLLSAHLPTGERIQIVLNPATLWLSSNNCPSASIAISIRKLHTRYLQLNSYDKSGGFLAVGQRQESELVHQKKLQEYLRHKQYADLLRYAVTHHQTILLSGATYSGKTSFLNMLLQEIPLNERIITIEDVPELHVPHANQVRLFYSRGSQSRASVQASDLVMATLRMRPDRIILGELRGDDAVHWLTAANSGHPGTLATIHADEPQLALEKLALMVMAHQQSLRREEVLQYITSIIDIVVQLKRNQQGQRYVSDILLTHG